MHGVIVIIFMGLGGSKWCRGDVLNSFGMQSHKGISLYNTHILKLLGFTGYCKSLCRKTLFNIVAALPVLCLLIYDKLRVSINVCIT